MLSFVARSDPGKKRERRQDAHLAAGEAGIFVVADGGGGRAPAQLAATLCVDAFEQAAARIAEKVAAFAAAPAMETRNDVLAAMDEILQQASCRIYETAEADGPLGMTACAVAIAVGPSVVFVAHVGDARAYMVRNGELRQLTEDHSMVNDLLRAGRLTYEQARVSEHRHVVARALGLHPAVLPALASVDLLPGDRLVLCSDGLSDVVAPRAIRVHGTATDLESGADALLRAAVDGGGDDITLILLDPEGGARTDEASFRAGLLEDFSLFEDVPYAARLQLERIAVEHTFAPGDQIVAQGEPGTSLFVVRAGTVSVRVDGIELARLGPGEHFGELCMTDRLPRSATVAAVTRGSAISISHDHLQAFCRQEPVLGNLLLWKLLRVLGRRLRQTNTRVASNQAQPGR